ncbi:MAG: hypothetical protein ACJ8LG_11045 [Massilia sp.]
MPFVLSLVGLLLAHDAAPAIPFAENPISLFNGAVLVAACGLLVAPRILKWNWDVRYFGASLFHISSLTLLCTVPCLCLFLYGSLPFAVRAGVFSIYIAVHIWWSRRFILLYSPLAHDTALRDFLYQEEDDAVYYMQRADKQLMDKHWKFNQIPKDLYFGLGLLVSFLILPGLRSLSAAVGLPVIHVYLLVSSPAISVMVLGLATKAWLVFYYYPAKITKKTGKRVFVDMTGKPGPYNVRKGNG